MDDIFSIIKISYNPDTKEAVGGVCGTCFFINQDTFLSAYHCCNEKIFVPNEGFKKVKTFLLNEAGELIDNFRLKETFVENDLTIGKIKNKRNAVGMRLDFGDNFEKEKIINLGFLSQESLEVCVLDIQEDKSLVIREIKVKIRKIEGVVEKVLTIGVDANDVKLEKQEVLLIDKNLVEGFSGSPLIHEKTGNVIGFMVMVLPLKCDVEQRAIAVPLKNIKEKGNLLMFTTK